MSAPGLYLGELHFERVGFWRNRELPLSQGLTLILGDNEAGKSTALRAIDALLCGPTAELVAPLGQSEFTARARLFRGVEQVELERRRKRLQAPGGGDIDPRLAAWLTPAWTSQFQQLFRLTHDELRAGGAALLASGGAVSRILLAAQAGRIAIDAAYEEIEGASERLFKPTQAKTDLKVALNDLQQKLEAQRNVLRFAHYQVAEADAERAEQAFQLADAANGAAKDAHDRVLRLGKARPDVLAWAALAEEEERRRKEQGGVPSAQWAQGVRRALHDATSQRERVEAEHAKAVKAADELVELPAASPLLPRAALIEALVERKRAYDARAKAEGTAQTERVTAEAALQQALSELGRPSSDDVEFVKKLVIPKPAQRRFKDSLDAVDTAAAKTVAVEGELRKAEQAGGDAQARLEALPAAQDPEPVQRALELEEQRAELEEAAGEHAEARASEAQALAAGLAKLGFAVRPPQDCQQLPAPDRREAEQQASRLLELRDTLKARRGKADDAAARLAEEQARQKLAGRTGPSPADLDRARQQRDEAYASLRSRWLPSLAADAAQRLAADAPRYEVLVQGVDLIVDGLLQSATEVERSRAAAEALGSREHEHRQAQALAEEADGVVKTALAGYAAVFPPEVQSPPAAAELSAWFATLESVKATACRWAKAESERAVAEGRARVQGEKLATLLSEQGIPATRSLSAELTARQKAEHRREQLEEGLVTAQALLRAKAGERVAAADALRSAQDAWATLARELPAGVGAKLEEARAWLEQQGPLAQALQKRDQALATLAERTGERERLTLDTRACLEDLQATWGFATTLMTQTFSSAVPILAKALSDAQALELKRDTVRGASVAATKRVEEEQEKLRGSEEKVSRFAAEAGLDAAAAPERLEELAVVAEKAAEDARSREALERAVVARGLGSPAALVAGELSGMDEASLARRAQETLETQAAAASARDEAQGKLREAKKHLVVLRESSGAAVAQELEDARGTVLTVLERVVPGLAALAILERAQERALEGAEPFLAEAGGFLSKLTNGAWVGLSQAGTPEAPTLQAHSGEGVERDAVKLSDGTRDQLWLALRLAAIARAHRTLPMPLVLDDVMVHFDVHRTRALLEVLAELAQSMQILVFTHHDHVLDVAAEAIPGKFTELVLAEAGTARLRASGPRRVRPVEPEADAAVGSDAPGEADGGVDLVEEIVAVLGEARGWLGKGDVLEALHGKGLSLSGAEWAAAIRDLVGSGRVLKEGEKRGAKYACQPSAGATG